MFITALLTVALDWDQTKYLFTYELINSNFEILLSHKNKELQKNAIRVYECTSKMFC